MRSFLLAGLLEFPSSQTHSPQSREAFATQQLYWKCWFAAKMRRPPDQTHQMLDLIGLCFLGGIDGANRGEQRSEVNCEPSVHYRHNQGSLTF